MLTLCNCFNQNSNGRMRFKLRERHKRKMMRVKAIKFLFDVDNLLLNNRGQAKDAANAARIDPRRCL
jgi:hypothetical protein